MLQRVQTVFLFLVFVFSILFVSLPLAYFPAEAATPLRVINYNSFLVLLDIQGAGLMGMSLVILFAMAAFITIFITFQYKRRKQQMRLGKFNMVIHAAMLILAFFFIDSIKAQVNHADFSYGAAIFFPIISLLLILMANRAIRKDEELVRSADRFR